MDEIMEANFDESLEGCGVIDGLSMGQCKWNHSPVTYYETMEFNGFTRAEVKELYDEAFARWARVSGLKVKRVESKSEANVVADTGFLLLALGWSGLPCGGVSSRTQLSQTFRSNGRFSRSDLLEVLTHEIGHALGLGHQSGTIMSAAGTGHKELTPKDIANIQERYGAPGPSPDPNPDPTPTPTPGPTAPTTIALGQELDLPKGTHELTLLVPSKGFLWMGKTTIKVESIGSTEVVLMSGSSQIMSGMSKIQASVRGGTYVVKVTGSTPMLVRAL